MDDLLTVEPFGFFTRDALRAGWYLAWRQLIRVVPLAVGALLIGAGPSGSSAIGSPESCMAVTRDIAQPVARTATPKFAKPSTAVSSLPSAPSTEPLNDVATKMGGVRISAAMNDTTVTRQTMAHQTRAWPVSG